MLLLREPPYQQEHVPNETLYVLSQTHNAQKRDCHRRCENRFGGFSDREGVEGQTFPKVTVSLTPVVVPGDKASQLNNPLTTFIPLRLHGERRHGERG